MNITRIQDSVFLTSVTVDKRKSKLGSKTDSFSPVGATFMEILGQEQEQRKKEEMSEEERKEKERERLQKEWEIAQMHFTQIKDEYKGNNIDWAG